MGIRSIVRAGICAALLAVSAWVSIPLGPVPFTLQTMVLAMLPAVLDGGAAIAAVGTYLLLGALGLPVFSAFGSGLGTILGPTGGFLWGFLLGTVAAAALCRVIGGRMSRRSRAALAAVAILLASYACGTVQLMAVARLDFLAALMLAVVPFVIPDAIKVAFGVQLGCLVADALGRGVARG